MISRPVCSAPVEQIEIAIRWRDVDNYGHVNNAVYLTYLEECRDRWVRRTLGDDVGFVIVRVAIDFRRELSLEDEVGHGRVPGHRLRNIVDPDRGDDPSQGRVDRRRVGVGDRRPRRRQPEVTTDHGSRSVRRLDAAIEADRARSAPEGSGGRIVKCWRYQPSPTHMIVTPPGVLLESSENPLPMYVST